MKRLLPAVTAAATAFLVHAQVAIAASGSAVKGEDSKPLNLPLDKVNESSSTGGGTSTSGSLGRTLFGLLVVVLVIYALYWILKQVKKSKEDQAHGNGLHSLATLPLGGNRSLHMIRAGREIVLVGVAEHGVSPIRSYSEEEAFEAGLIGSPDEGDDTGSGTGGGAGTNGQKFASPGQAIGSALEALRNKTVRK